MVSADGLSRDSLKTIAYVKFHPCERPFGIQIFGSDPIVMAKAAEMLADYAPDFIDINMGCPVKKVIKRNAGGALMRNPSLAATIVKAVRSGIGTASLLTVKFRSGWDVSSLNYNDFGSLMADSGADAVCLHPRTVKQGFSGTSNWQHIYILKRHLSIPVIGNGDITMVELALRMFRDTFCDSIMIGRGAVGKPWFFHQIKQALSGETEPAVTPRVIMDTIMDHIDLALEINPPEKVVREMRTHLCQYTKGLTDGSTLRDKLNHCHSITELQAHLTQYFA